MKIMKLMHAIAFVTSLLTPSLVLGMRLEDIKEVREQKITDPKLIQAILQPNKSAVEKLASPFNVNIKDERGRTPLMYASEKGDPQIAQILISSGANVNEKSKSGGTPLMLAAYYGHKDLVKLLLNKKADVHAKNSVGKTVLDIIQETLNQPGLTENQKAIYNDIIVTLSMASARSPKPLETPQLPVKRPREIQQPEEQQLVSIEQIKPTVTTAPPEITLPSSYPKEFLKEIIQPTPQVTQRLHQLHEAIKSGKIDEAKELIRSKKVNLDEKDKDDRTPLMHAVFLGDAGLITFLIENGADVDITTKNGKTALQMLEILMKPKEKGKKARAEYNTLVELFRKASKKQPQQTQIVIPMQRVEQPGMTFVQIPQQQQRSNMLLEAVKANNVNEVKRLLALQQFNINIKDNDGNTLLLLALKQRNKDLAHLLINAGADVTIADNRGQTPLMLSLFFDDIEIMQSLLKKGAHIDAQNEKGITVLMGAMNGLGSKNQNPSLRLRFKNFAQFLINVDTLSQGRLKGADVNIADVNGNTPLMVAAASGDKDLVQLLLEKQAQVNTYNNSGVTALIAASFNGRREIVQLLLEKGADIYAKNNEGQTALMKVQNRLKQPNLTDAQKLAFQDIAITLLNKQLQTPTPSEQQPLKKVKREDVMEIIDLSDDDIKKEDIFELE